VSLNELYTVTENTVPIVFDEGFESETGEFGPNSSENTISEDLSVVNHSVDIPDVFNVGVDISMNNICGELPKCHNSVEVRTKEIEVECDFCPFVSTHVEEFYQHLRERHDNIQDLPWNSSVVRSGLLLPKVTSKKTVKQTRSRLIKQSDPWGEMCNFVDSLPKPEAC